MNREYGIFHVNFSDDAAPAEQPDSSAAIEAEGEPVAYHAGSLFLPAPSAAGNASNARAISSS